MGSARSPSRAAHPGRRPSQEPGVGAGTAAGARRPGGALLATTDSAWWPSAFAARRLPARVRYRSILQLPGLPLVPQQRRGQAPASPWPSSPALRCLACSPSRWSSVFHGLGPQEEGGGAPVGAALSDIAFDGGTFRYLQRSEPALRAVRFTLRTGERVPLAGGKGPRTPWRRSPQTAA